MTSYAPAERYTYHGLSAGVVDTVTFATDLNNITVTSRDSYATLWYTADGSTPVAAVAAVAATPYAPAVAAVAGVGTSVAPGASSAATAGANVIKLISSVACDYLLVASPGKVVSKPTLGIMNTGMISVVSGNHGYPVPSSGSLANNGGAMTISQRQVLTDTTEARMIIANRYFTSAVPAEVDGPNDVVQRHSVLYPWGTLKYVAGSTAWSSGQAYMGGDVVTLAGNAYVCKVGNTNSTPVVAGTANWAQVGIYPLHFAGESAARDVTLHPGQHLISDPFSADLKSGTMVGLACFGSPNNGTANTGSYPTGFALQAFGGDWYINAVSGSAVASDFTTAFPTTTVTQTGGQNDLAGILIGKAGLVTGNRRMLSCIGDSIPAGSGDATLFGNNEPGGWVRRSINRAYPHIIIAHTGDTLAGFSTSGLSQSRHSFAGDPDVYLAELETNDMNIAFATLQAEKLAEWAYYKNRGALVVQALIQPRCSTTDAGATTVNQTDATGFTPVTGNRDLLNAWYRSKPAGVDYVLDFLSVIETSPGSNRWRNPANGDAFVYSTDCTHPTTLACTAIAAVAGPVLASIMASLGT